MPIRPCKRSKSPSRFRLRVYFPSEYPESVRTARQSGGSAGNRPRLRFERRSGLSAFRAYRSNGRRGFDVNHYNSIRGQVIPRCATCAQRNDPQSALLAWVHQRTWRLRAARLIRVCCCGPRSVFRTAFKSLARTRIRATPAPIMAMASISTIGFKTRGPLGR